MDLLSNYNWSKMTSILPQFIGILDGVPFVGNRILGSSDRNHSLCVVMPVDYISGAGYLLGPSGQLS